MNGEKTIRGRFVLPVEGPPIPGGTVTIRDGRIIEVWKRESAEIEDLGNVAICPGFVNAHVHWEFSRLAAPLGKAGKSLLDWIPRVIAYRQETGCAEDPGAVRTGMLESRETQTAVAAEIVQPGASLDVLAEGNPEAVAFLELIGPTPERAESTLAAAEDWIAEAVGRHPALKLGLSPHAPFTVHPILLEGAVRLAKKWNLPLAMHYAESAEERRFLDRGTGPFRAMLESMGTWSPALAPRTDILSTLAEAGRTLIIHGTHLNETEIAFLAEHAETMSVVYCPRSTAYFGAEDYPLEKLLDAGVRVALGTDGRASTPNLNILDEMRFAAARHPEVSAETILRMATLAGAEALGIEEDYGSLAPGKQATPAVIRLEEGAGDAFELALRGGGEGKDEG